MNRNIYLLFVKSMFALLILLASNKSFAAQAIAINSGDFNNAATWGGTTYTQPSGLSLGDDMLIKAGVTVKITSNVLFPTLNLIIESGGHLVVTAPSAAIKITVNDLTMDSGSSSTDIDFGIGNVTFTVGGNLKGGLNSTITHTPGPKKIQNLILKGPANTLDNFYSDISGGGFSIVSYEGGDQIVFPSFYYATLLIGGTGTKTLSAESFNTGTVTNVSKKLELKGKLKLGAFDLVYKGSSDSLVYNDGTAVTGWIWTDGTGMLKHNHIDGIRTFPVGNGLEMKVLVLTDIDNTTGLESGVRYNPSEPNVIIPNAGAGTWVLYSNNPCKATLLLGNPVSANTVLNSPSIIVSATGITGSWSSLVTTKPAPDATAYWSQNASINSGKSYIAFISCPTLKISSSTLPGGVKNADYVYNSLVVSNGTAPYTLSSFSSAPSGFSVSMISPANGTIQVSASPIPATSSNYFVGFQISDASGCQTPFSYNINAIEPSSPNLYITPITAKTYGDADFKISVYTKNTTVPITYSISPNTCAEIVSGNMVHIKCAGPIPNNSITVTASQEASGIYKSESVSTTFFINKAQAKLYIKNTGFLPNTNGQLITDKKSDGTLTFTQLTGSGLATVSSDGQVITSVNTGTFTVLANIAATDNYTAFDTIYTFAVYTTKQPPVAVNDTITIQMGQDTTFNIVSNDYGVTDPINSTLTDIDIENTGMQKKYYSTSLGTFTIDPAGLLSIHPFEGFIGTDKIGYTVTDEAGLTSDIAYLVITVEEPAKIPALKGNEFMTPNNDGLNDALVIANTNIELPNSLVITDQVGNVVFEQSNYRNDWKGTNKNGNLIGAGVYFYVFTEKNTGRMLQNYLQIQEF